jgi:outer membrane protein OmpU
VNRNLRAEETTQTQERIMKKVLLTTTVLALSATVAAADVSLSGYARSGLSYNSDTNKTSVISRLRIQADMSATADNGLSVNARQRFQTEENATGNGGNAMRFGISMGGLSVNLGNINGAVESAPNLYMPTASAGMGLEGNGWESLAVNTGGGAFGWTAYSSGGAGATNGAELIYSMNGLTAHVHTVRDTSNGIGINYSMNGMTLAYAEESFENDDKITFMSAGFSLGDVDMAIAYGKTDLGGVEDTKTSVKGSTNLSAATQVYAFAAEEESAGSSYGIGVAQDMGGISLQAGYTRNENEVDTTSAGLLFKF